jgi:predicted Zn finger-like uncharacterized protein
MKVTCSACQSTYTIADEKVPLAGARVRCRKCQAVFTIPPRASTGAPGGGPGADPAVPDASPPAPEAIRPAPLPTVPPAGESPAPPEVPPRPSAPAQASAAEGPAAAPRPAAPAVRPAAPAPAAPAGPAAAPAPAKGVRLAEAHASLSPIPEGLSPEDRVKHERARRLARVLASDIAIYNKEKCERGVRDGNLVAVLGYEIKKSWEVYKERVTPELANSTPYFRDALNEMLGEGKKIF